MNLQEMIDKFVGDVCAGKTNETPVAYRRKLRHLVVYFDNRPVETITSTDVEQWRQWMLERKTKKRGWQEVDGHLSPVTLHTTIATVKSFFKWIYKRGHLTSNLADTTFG